MTSKKDFFEINPPPRLDEKIGQMADELLAEKRKRVSRRQSLQWILVPALAFGSLVLTWRFFKTKQAPNLNLLDFADWSFTEEGDFDLVSELDFIENLDELEKEEDT
jgi:hypothetical protein